MRKARYEPIKNPLLMTISTAHDDESNQPSHGSNKDFSRLQPQHEIHKS